MSKPAHPSVCNKCITLVGAVENGGGLCKCGDRGYMKIFVLSPKFCCELKLLTKNKVLIKKKVHAHICTHFSPPNLSISKIHMSTQFFPPKTQPKTCSCMGKMDKREKEKLEMLKLQHVALICFSTNLVLTWNIL